MAVSEFFVVNKEEDHVLIRGQLANTLIYQGDDFHYEAKHYIEVDSQEHGFEAFMERFSVETSYTGNPGHLLDKENVYIYGLTCVRVIHDNETGSWYGLRYRQGMGKHDEDIHPDENGEGEWYRFDRVYPFSLRGFEFYRKPTFEVAE